MLAWWEGKGFAGRMGVDCDGSKTESGRSNPGRGSREGDGSKTGRRWETGKVGPDCRLPVQMQIQIIRGPAQIGERES